MFLVTMTHSPYCMWWIPSLNTCKILGESQESTIYYGSDFHRPQVQYDSPHWILDRGRSIRITRNEIMQFQTVLDWNAP